MDQNKNETIKPIFRWAGGKNWLVKYLKTINIPEYKSYHEPFLGGGSVFFYLKPNSKVFLSDINNELINAYKVIRDNTDDLLLILQKFENTEDEYYRVRKEKLNDSEKIRRAAKFIYLNRTGFNGLYRVNLKGEYNVPYGYKKYKQLFNYDQIRMVSKLLRDSVLDSCDFLETVRNIKESDFVFIDPPYTVTHVNNVFIKYNEKIFSWKDQERLAEFVTRIKDIGAFYMMTNAKHKDIEELYGQIDKPISISRASVIGGLKAKRGKFEEFIFTNIKQEDYGGI